MIVGPNKVSQTNNLTFTTTDTLRNENVEVSSLNSNYVISIDGAINQNSEPTNDSASITLVGGKDTFVSEKQAREPLFYMTVRQKLTVYAILKSLALRTDSGSVSSDVPVLDTIVKAAYTNFRG